MEMTDAFRFSIKVIMAVSVAHARLDVCYICLKAREVMKDPMNVKILIASSAGRRLRFLSAKRVVAFYIKNETIIKN